MGLFTDGETWVYLTTVAKVSGICEKQRHESRRGKVELWIVYVRIGRKKEGSSNKAALHLRFLN